MGGLAARRFQPDRLSAAIRSLRMLKDTLRRILSSFRNSESRCLKDGFLLDGAINRPLARRCGMRLYRAGIGVATKI